MLFFSLFCHRRVQPQLWWSWAASEHGRANNQGAYCSRAVRLNSVMPYLVASKFLLPFSICSTLNLFISNLFITSPRRNYLFYLLFWNSRAYFLPTFSIFHVIPFFVSYGADTPTFSAYFFFLCLLRSFTFPVRKKKFITFSFSRINKCFHFTHSYFPST